MVNKGVGVSCAWLMYSGRRDLQRDARCDARAPCAAQRSRAGGAEGPQQTCH